MLNAPPLPDYDFLYDDDDLCADCGEPLDYCVCNTDDELDEFDGWDLVE